MTDDDSRSSTPATPGRLTIVATPIGNLEDASPRSIATLREADLVACEDTRRTGLLLQRLGVDKRPLLSLHDHNEARRVDQVIERLSGGESVALVSDAGTPLISDPGYRLIRAAIERHIPVDGTPGPAAAILALVLSGLPPQPFTFAGFVPPKEGSRRKFLRRFADLDHTLVLFEAPHRLVACLRAAEQVFGNRPAAVARELTKIHQEVVRGSLGDLAAEFSSRAAIKGEITLVIAGGPGS